MYECGSLLRLRGPQVVREDLLWADGATAESVPVGVEVGHDRLSRRSSAAWVQSANAVLRIPC